jgi:hypothetical protein
VSGRPAPTSSHDRPHAAGWRSAVPELIIAAGLVASAGAAGYALGGPATMAVVVVVAATAGLAVLRTFVPAAQRAGSLDTADPDPAVLSYFSSSSDYWRKLARVTEGTASMSAYDAGLRRTLEHLLASRAAERHGVSLYDDPAAARRLLCPDGRDADLWPWIDPAGQQSEATDAGGRRDSRAAPGIPQRTLLRLIDRLEHL